MASKYEKFWSERLATILVAVKEARTTNSDVALPMTAIEPLGDRQSWSGALQITDGELASSESAHMAALGKLLAGQLPAWAQEGVITATMDKELNLHLHYSEPAKLQEDFDITARLNQWMEEATNPDNPNYHHAELDRPVAHYRQILALVSKLRTDTEAFDRDDVVKLFGLLNSGQRTKDRVAANNSLPELRLALLTLLDGDASPSDAINTAANQIRYAGPAMLGELYGWVHAEEAPLFNNCAIDALAYLGYDVRIGDYDGFVAAHEQFKQVYQTQVGHLREDLPLNLEIDKFYNVIDKVDLVANVSSPGRIIAESSPRMGTVGQLSSVFSPQTFDLLAGLHEAPTAEFYKEHKTEFQTQLENPFKGLLASVADKFPSMITDSMETRKRVVARILKNDWGQGGAWDYYWGAFYPKGGKRTTDAQLSAFINRDYLEFGFYFGDSSVDQRQRFERNAVKYRDQLLEMLDDLNHDDRFLYGPPDTFMINPDGTVTQNPADVATLADFLADPARFVFDVSVIVSKHELLQMSQAALVARIAETHMRLFPLVLLAVNDDPLPAITDYLDLKPDNGGDDLAVETVRNVPYPLKSIAEKYGFELQLLARWVRAIERKQQAIFYGPPGTGKTFVAEQLARHLIGDGDGFSELVQFHPAYAYEDFIQGIRPGVADGNLTYRMAEGRFLEFCRKAEARTDTCVLIVDEINRANLARVFGELMYLLEYRDQAVPLAGGGTLRIPGNVRIIGTMNTADRSIALVDHALRRRFAFLALQPDFQILRHYHHQRHATGFPLDGLVGVLTDINRAINDPHYELGITYFLRTDLAAQIADIWQMEIEPYLEEFFFDQRETVNRFQWSVVQPRIEP